MARSRSGESDCLYNYYYIRRKVGVFLSTHRRNLCGTTKARVLNTFEWLYVPVRVEEVDK